MQPNVIQILPALDVGGVERGTLEIAKGLVDRGYGSLVVSAGGRLVHQLELEGSKHITLDVGKKSVFTLRHISTLKKIFNKNKINIIHVRSRMPAWVAYFAREFLETEKKPVFISTVHGPYSVNFYSKIMVKSQKIIAISNYIKNYITQNYPDVDPNIITVINRGVDTNIYNPDFCTDKKWQCPWSNKVHGNEFIVTIPARITHWKGQMDFVEIIKQLLNRGLPIHGVIAGAPHKQRKKFYNKLKSKIHDYNLENFISLIGQRDDMKQIMKASDVVVSLAKTPEAFGRTALEALSLGTPVVAYDHGGASEVLNELFPEGLVQPHNIEAAADKLYTLINKDINITIKHDHPFTLDRMINETIRVYESCLDN